MVNESLDFVLELWDIEVWAEVLLLKSNKYFQPPGVLLAGRKHHRVIEDSVLYHLR
jgi:hypothetical protein